MFPLIILAALGAAYYLTKKGETAVVKASTGDLYKLRIRVQGADNKQQIESLYRLGLSQVAQIGTIIWDGNDMIVQLQYLIPSTIKLGASQAGTTNVNVVSAELLGRALPPVMPAFAHPSQAQAATVGAATRKALATGDPADLMGAAAVAERCGAQKLSRKLERAALHAAGYRVMA